MTEKRPKLFVIGASGFVGSTIAHHAADSFDVFRRLAPCGAEQRQTVAIDITQSESVRQAFDTVRPDVGDPYRGDGRHRSLRTANKRLPSR